MSKKINLALVFGGRSVEHDVSIRSAKNIQENLDMDAFDLVTIGVDKKGKWFLMPNVSSNFSEGVELNLKLDRSQPTFIPQDQSNPIDIDVAFVIIHGTDGEDGTIQGFFKMMGIPVVGSGVLGSSLAMNKKFAKKILLHEKIPTAKCIFVDKESVPTFQDATDKLGDVLIVKPANLGSSVGVSKVVNENEYANAIDNAFKFDRDLLIEEFVEARELECAILGNTDIQASVAGEILLNPEYDFYSFDAKYVDGDSCVIKIPAEISKESHEKIKQHCIDAYNALGCSDFARVDLFLTKRGEIYINEVNTLPGFTNISMYPKLAEHMGIDYTRLITILVNLAVDRFEMDKKLETEFESGLS